MPAPRERCLAKAVERLEQLQDPCGLARGRVLVLDAVGELDPDVGVDLRLNERLRDVAVDDG